MARRKRIGIDLDGVLADFVYSFTELILSRNPGLHNLPFYAEEQATLPLEGNRGITGAMVEAAWETVHQAENWWERLPLIPTPQEIRQLQAVAAVHDVVMVTARAMEVGVSGPPLTVQTRNWLNEHGLGNVGLVFATDKAPLVQAARLDLYFDDEPRHLEAMPKLERPPALFLQDRPYNRYWTADDVERIANLGEFLARVEAYEVR